MGKPELEIETEITTQNVRHVVIKVFQNGGLAGELIVETEHSDEMVFRLEGAVPKRPECHICGEDEKLKPLPDWQEPCPYCAISFYYDRLEKAHAQLRKAFAPKEEAAIIQMSKCPGCGVTSGLFHQDHCPEWSRNR